MIVIRALGNTNNNSSHCSLFQNSTTCIEKRKTYKENIKRLCSLFDIKNMTATINKKALMMVIY